MTRQAVPPHPVLDAYYLDPQERQEYVDGFFDQAAHHYDRINRIMSFGSGAWYRGKALRNAAVREGETVVDVACGTGVISAIATKLVGPTGKVIGVDPSAGMRKQAEQRGITVLEGHAESLPIEDESADVVTMGYALRHASDLRAAFAEFHRVLRPGGRVLILEISRPQSKFARAMLGGYLGTVVPTLALLTTGNRHARRMMQYYWESIDQCVPPDVIVDALSQENFDDVRRRVDMGMFSEYFAVRG